MCGWEQVCKQLVVPVLVPLGLIGTLMMWVGLRAQLVTLEDPRISHRHERITTLPTRMIFEPNLLGTGIFPCQSEQQPLAQPVSWVLLRGLPPCTQETARTLWERRGSIAARRTALWISY